MIATSSGPTGEPTTAGTSVRMPGTPKPWMNKLMAGMLRCPGVRSLMGRTFAIITVTGATTGREYATPVQYVRLEGDGDREELVVLSQEHRMWWRNIRTRPDVRMTIAGRERAMTARVAADREAVEYVGRVLRQVPRVAKFYGIAVEDGEPAADGIEALARRVAVIVLRAA